jgi:transcriptional regulator EpsA
MRNHDLEPEHAESLLRLIEGSLQVKRQHQFYLWTQGDMQRLVPHRLSTCGSYDLGVHALTFHVLNTQPLPAELVATLANAHSPVMQHLQTEWSKVRQTCWIDMSGLVGRDASARMLVEHGYRWLMVSGMSRPARPNDIESFFVFGLPGCTPDEQSAHGLAMLLPYLHVTLVRVHGHERELSPGRSNLALGMGSAMDKGRTVSAITEREREILSWVREGKSNQAISEELGISALTVKNHIQKILRKLGAANRAQAVAKAMSMNLFSLTTEPVLPRVANDFWRPEA